MSLKGQNLPGGVEIELSRAYEAAIGTALLSEPHISRQVITRTVLSWYERAWSAYQHPTPQSHLIAERWAKAVKHLALAYEHESRVHYLESKSPSQLELPLPPSSFSIGKDALETARSLLDNAGENLLKAALPVEGAVEMLLRARTLFQQAVQTPLHGGLLNTERLRAAYEYGRTLEYFLLAIEAESSPPDLIAA